MLSLTCLVDTREVPYACPTCSKRFRRQDVHRRHLRKSCPGKSIAGSVFETYDCRRSKANKACDRCRLRKVKCNGGSPCDRCKRQTGHCSNLVDDQAVQLPSSPVLDTLINKLGTKFAPLKLHECTEIAENEGRTCPTPSPVDRRHNPLSFIGGILPEETFAATIWPISFDSDLCSDSFSAENMKDCSCGDPDFRPWWYSNGKMSLRAKSSLEQWNYSTLLH